MGQNIVNMPVDTEDQIECHIKIETGKDEDIQEPLRVRLTWPVSDELFSDDLTHLNFV